MARGIATLRHTIPNRFEYGCGAWHDLQTAISPKIVGTSSHIICKSLARILGEFDILSTMFRKANDAPGTKQLCQRALAGANA